MIRRQKLSDSNLSNFWKFGKKLKYRVCIKKWNHSKQLKRIWNINFCYITYQFSKQVCEKQYSGPIFRTNCRTLLLFDHIVANVKWRSLNFYGSCMFSSSSFVDSTFAYHFWYKRFVAKARFCFNAYPNNLFTPQIIRRFAQVENPQIVFGSMSRNTFCLQVLIYYPVPYCFHDFSFILSVLTTKASESSLRLSSLPPPSFPHWKWAVDFPTSYNLAKFRAMCTFTLLLSFRCIAALWYSMIESIALLWIMAVHWK